VPRGKERPGGQPKGNTGSVVGAIEAGRAALCTTASTFLRLLRVTVLTHCLVIVSVNVIFLLILLTFLRRTRERRNDKGSLASGPK
jgi:hypothetical protein